MNTNELVRWLKLPGSPKQIELCRRAGMGESHLSLLLRGKRGVSWPKAKRLSAATGGAVSVDALMQIKTKKRSAA